LSFAQTFFPSFCSLDFLLYLLLSPQDPLAMLSMAWPVALGPATPSPSPAAGLAGPAGASAAALALGVAEALPLDGGGAGGDGGRAAGAAAIHAARLEDALLLEVACNILEQVLRFSEWAKLMAFSRACTFSGVCVSLAVSLSF
jgi:hypothetical protein